MVWPNKQKKVPLKGPLNAKVPRIAKRNLRDHGCLPRRRGPDKLGADETNSNKGSMASEMSDEFVPGIQDVETQNRLAITLNQRAAIRPKPSISFT